MSKSVEWNWKPEWPTYQAPLTDEYSMDYAVTATQKSILKAFDLAETNIRKQAAGINEDLKPYDTKEA